MNRKTVNTILELGALAAIVYGAYELGKYHEKNKANVKPEPLLLGNLEEKDELKEVQDTLRELRQKPNKTQKDRNNIELLQVKLKQLTK